MRMLSYLSNAQLPTLERKASIQQLMEVAQKRNDELEISGVLFLRGNTFLQTIEGPDDTLKEVFKSIVADSRHNSICFLVSETVERRRFSGWSLECFHDHAYSTDYDGTLQEINEYFKDEACFSASNVYSYFFELADELAPYRLSRAA